MLARAHESRKDAIFNAGITAAAVYNSAPFREEGSPPVRPADFLPEERPEMTEDEIADAAAAFFADVSRKQNRRTN
jgi:hypothetical protein